MIDYLHAALEHHRSGRLLEAGQIYQALLNQHPAQADVLHLLGLVSHQSGDSVKALSLVEKAIVINGTFPDFYNSQGDILRSLGRYDEAEKSLRRALVLNPNLDAAACNLAMVLLLLGRNAEAKLQLSSVLDRNPSYLSAWVHLGKAHRALGYESDAEACFRRALDITTLSAEPWAALGDMLADVGRIPEALSCLKRSLDLAPTQLTVRNRLATLLHTQGQLADAVVAFSPAAALHPESPDVAARLAELHHAVGDITAAADWCRRSIALNPGDARTYHHLGLLCQELGHGVEALCHYRRAVSLQPTFPEPFNNMANIMRAAGKFDEAEALYREAIMLSKERSEFHFNLANLYATRKKWDDAISSYRAAIQLNPGLREAWNNCAVAHHLRGELDAALLCYKEVLRIDPGSLQGHANAASVLLHQGRHDLAVTSVQRALELNPEYVEAHRMLLLMIHYTSTWTHEQRFAEHLRYASRLQMGCQKLPAQHKAYDPQKKLRIAYMSSDFFHHSISRNMLPLIRAHDRTQFEIYCYGDVEVPDVVTAMIQAAADRWRPITGMTDQEVAEVIHRDDVDILVCLAAHFDRNRPNVMSFRPAPVQISHHDIATTGLDACDYILTDRVMTPGNGEEKFSERPFRLPSYYLGEVVGDLPPVNVRSGPVVFGCFNNPGKITSTVIALWADILHQTPGSTLLLKYRNWYSSETLCERIMALFLSHGIGYDRVSMRRVGMSVDTYNDSRHLSLYNDVDISLDTFPFSGSTTTFESLLMGVPVITLLGPGMVGRWSGSMLRSLDFADFVADTKEVYVRIAVTLANDCKRRATIRATLRQRVLSSPLCNAGKRARQIERAYRAMWGRACLNL